MIKTESTGLGKTFHEKVIEIDTVEVDEKGQIRINIQDEWKSMDMAKLFGSLTKLYRYNLHLFYLLKIIDDYHNSDVKYEHYTHVSIQIDTHYTGFVKAFDENYSTFIVNDLIIKELRYSSPGFADIVGVGKVLGQLKEILFYYFPNKKDKIEADIKIQERNKLIIENLKGLEIDPHVMRQLFLKEYGELINIGNLIEEGKIKSIE